MDKGTYVKKLEKMIKRYPIEDLCNHCPAVFRMGSFVATVSIGTCKMCQEFIGLHFVHRTDGCPCNRLRRSEAVARATMAIDKYKDLK